MVEGMDRLLVIGSLRDCPLIERLPSPFARVSTDSDFAAECDKDGRLLALRYKERCEFVQQRRDRPPAKRPAIRQLPPRITSAVRAIDRSACDFLASLKRRSRRVRGRDLGIVHRPVPRFPHLDNLEGALTFEEAGKPSDVHSAAAHAIPILAQFSLTA